MKSKRLLLVALLFTSLVFSQENSTKDTKKNLSAIEELKELVDKSNNFKEYKVVDEETVDQAIQKVKSEIDLINTKVLSLNDSISAKAQSVLSLEKEVSLLNKKLNNEQNQKDEIAFLGMPLEKSTYNTMVWSIIVVLIILLLFFIFKFNRSNLLTKEARQNLKNLDTEYENYKRIALEKQQKLGRELQDEKNKNLKANKSI